MSDQMTKRQFKILIIDVLRAKPDWADTAIEATMAGVRAANQVLRERNGKAYWALNGALSLIEGEMNDGRSAEMICEYLEADGGRSKFDQQMLEKYRKKSK